jgi:hypothetical protein
MKTQSKKRNNKPVKIETSELKENVMEKEESVFGHFLIGAAVLIISFVLIVAIITGIAYLYNP